METSVTRTLGRSGIMVSGLGMGCWAIGGPAWRDGKPIGWGDVDDAESVRAIHRALDLGVTLFDTADIYGAGHSERILGQALVGRRQQVVIASKFGQRFDEARARRSAATPAQRISAARARRVCGDCRPTISTSISSTSATTIWSGRLRCARRWRSWCRRARFAPTAGAPTSGPRPSVR